MFGVGCQEYNWRDDYVRAEEQAREQGKDLFIFYKWYLDPDSNRMLSNQLSDPEVKVLFRDTINLLLDKSYPVEYRDYVRKYGVSSYPASVIVNPDGRFSVKHGNIPKKELIAWVEEAKTPPAKEPQKPPG